MIPGFIQRLFALNHPYDNIVEQQRAQRLLYIIGLLFLTTLFWIIVFIIPSLINGNSKTDELILAPIILGFSFALYRLIQQGQVIWSSRIFVALIFVVVFPTTIERLNSPLLINMMLPLVLAGVLLGRRALAFVVSLIILIILRGMFFGGVDTGLDTTDSVSLAIAVLLSGLFLGLFNSSLEQITRSASRLITQTRGLNKYKSDTSEGITQPTIIANAINLLRSDLGFNYVRVIILNEDQQPLQTFYSSIGIEQIAETTAFSFTRNSAFQHAINTTSAQIITQQDAGNLTVHLLPSTSVGVVIPAQHFNQTIALFDIQTESDQPIEQETIAILNLFIGQFASNLLYQRMVSTLREDLTEQQNIINQQRQQLQHIQHQQAEGIITDWQNYLQQRGLDAIGYDIDNKRQISTLNKGLIPEELRPAFEKGETLVQSKDHEQLITIPIHFRETILGAISFTIPKELPMTDRKLEFIRSVTDRLALALDNKRLLEQTQTQAKREGVANEIGSILLTSTDVQTVLQTAADQFNEALGAVSTQIYLQPATLQPIASQKREDTL